jgi:hypothetical protein
MTSNIATAPRLKDEKQFTVFVIGLKKRVCIFPAAMPNYFLARRKAITAH